MADFEHSWFFTGPRAIASALIPALEHRTEAACKLLIRDNRVTDFIAGGARGFDTLAALTVLRLKNEFPDVRLRLYLPCTDQARRWGRRDVERWQDILDRADEYRFIHDGKYIPGCMQLRNRTMVDDAKYGIAYCSRSSGGAYYTVNYARDKERELICL